MMRIIFIAVFVTFVGADWDDHGEICFGALYNDFGTFTLTQTGKFHAVMLTHTRGFVSCLKDDPNRNRYYYKTRFGCNYRDTGKYVSTYVTTDKDAVIFPSSSTARFHHGGNFAEVKFMNSNSSVLAYSNWINPIRVVEGDKFRVWYGEDLRDSGDHDNDGRSCATVSTYVTE